MKTKIAAIIPARWASTRFPGKPLHPIAGKPLVQHVWERCRAAREVDYVIVATDDMRIAAAALAFGAEVSLTSARHRSGTDRVAEVAGRMPGISHVINVQGDEPVIDPALISRLAKTLRENPEIEMATAANAVTGEQIASPHTVKVVLDRASDALYFSRSAIPFFRESDSTPRYYRHQGIYGYSKTFLLQFVKWKPTPLEKAECLEQLRALEHGVKIRVLITRSVSMGIDTPEDVELVSGLLMKSS